MTYFYPTFLNIQDRLCSVIGGGNIAERKIQQLLTCGAKIVVISPYVTEDIANMAKFGQVTWVKRKYKKGDLKGVFLAIAATSLQQVNRRIASEANFQNTLLNVIDDKPLCTFIAPSVINKGDVTIAISTNGKSPALARKLRELFERSTEIEYASLAEIMNSARITLSKEQVRISPDHWQQCITQDLVDLLKSGKQQEALATLLNNLMNLARSR